MKNSVRQRILNEAKFGFSAERAVDLRYSKRPQPVRDIFSAGAFQVAAVLSEAWMATTNDRRSKFEILNDVLNMPIAKTIVKQMAYDVLNPTTRGDSIKFTASDELDKATQKLYQDELNSLCDKFNFNALLQQIVRDLIIYGEQAVRCTVKQGEGVTGIHNDVNILNLVALYEQGVPKRYLNFVDNQVYMYPAASYAHFVSGMNTMRVKLEDRLVPGYQLTLKSLTLNTTTNQETLKIPEWAEEELPDFIQTGEPLFEGFISKIRELQLLESLVVATKLNQITQSSVLGIPVENGLDPDEATKICREWEERLNSPTSIDFSKSQIGVADVIGQTGILKVVPIMANGKIETLAVRTNIPVDDLIKAINDVRKMITSNLGIPYSLIYGPENESGTAGGSTNRASELRMHARYVRTLAAIQLALRNGLSQIVLTHFRNKGDKFKDFNKNSFDIEFINALTDVTELERYEIVDAKNEIAMNAIDGVLKLYASPVTALMLNPQAVMDKLSEELQLLAPGHQIIKKQAPIELYKKDFLMSLKVAYDGGGVGVDDHAQNQMIGMKGEQYSSDEEELAAIKNLQLNEAQELLIAALEDPILFQELRGTLLNS